MCEAAELGRVLLHSVIATITNSECYVGSEKHRTCEGIEICMCAILACPGKRYAVIHTHRKTRVCTGSNRTKEQAYRKNGLHVESVPNSRSEGTSTAPPLSTCPRFLGRQHQPERGTGPDQSSAHQGKGGTRPAQSHLTTHPTCVCFGGRDFHPHSGPWQRREVPHRSPGHRQRASVRSGKLPVHLSWTGALRGGAPISRAPCKGPLFLPSVMAG